MVFQILNFENQASFRGKLGYKAENRESGENNGCLASENVWKNFTPNCRVAETPFKVDSSFSTEKSQKHFGFSDIPREKRLFLWGKIHPAEKCELCGRFAVEHMVKDPASGDVLRRCHDCFEQMHRTFSCSERRNIGEESFASKGRLKLIKRLLDLGADLSDPEEVKRVIASQP